MLTSNDLVAELVDAQRATIGGLLVRPELVIITTLGSDKAIETYFRSKANHANNVGIGFTPDSFEEEDAALRAIFDYNEDATTHAMVVQLPLKNRDRTSELCDAVVDYKDADALSAAGQKFFTPPTARASYELARYHTNDFDGIDKNRVAVIGALGRLVGRGVVPMLRKRGFDPMLIDIQLGNDAEIKKLGRNADLIITATGQPGLITPDALQRPAGISSPLFIIDGGIGVGKDGRPAQDLHPDVFNLEYVYATKRTKAVGPLAVGFMFGNVIEAAEQQLIAA